MKSFILLFSLLLISKSIGQSTGSWIKIYHGESKTIPCAMTSDLSGNIYVTGTTYSLETLDDVITMKINSEGDIQWVSKYNGIDSFYSSNLNDAPKSIKVDAKGNVYITGSSGQSTRYGTRYLTIKYDTSGNQLWAKTYQGLFWSFANDIALDFHNNVYVTGGSYGYNNEDSLNYLTIKYTTDGKEVWRRVYDGTIYQLNKHGNDIATAILIDKNDNIYITGYSQVNYSFTNPQFRMMGTVTVMYDTGGAQKWVKVFDHFARNLSIPILIADKNENIFVVTSGWNNWDDQISLSGNFSTTKYSAEGDQIWHTDFISKNNWSDHIAKAAVCAPDGHIIITGENAATTMFMGYENTTISLDASGNKIWENHFNYKNIEGFDFAGDIKTDNNSNIYFTGSSDVGDTTYNIITRKITSAGVVDWVKSYSGYGTKYNFARKLFVDALGNVYVVGEIMNETGVIDIVILKYDYLTTGLNNYEPNNKEVFQLSHNYPNPFNPVTIVEYQIPKYTFVSLKLYDILGKEVKTLVNEEKQPGEYEVKIDGSGLSSGVYLYQIIAGDYIQIHKMILQK